MSLDHNKIFICGGTANLPGLVDEIQNGIESWNEERKRPYEIKEFCTAPKPELAVFRGLSVLTADLHAAGQFDVSTIKKKDHFTARR